MQKLKVHLKQDVCGYKRNPYIYPCKKYLWLSYNEDKILMNIMKFLMVTL